MKVFVGTSRHLDRIQSEESDQDQSLILDMELWNNKKKGEKEVALFGQETNRADAGRLAVGTES